MMISLIQRVTSASVVVENVTIGEISRGLLVLVGVQKGDDGASARRMVERVLGYRVFEDQAGKMNLASEAIGGECT